jgi:beta-phosphoglucomutase-like phosphatase (HAD superfamily)
MNPAESIVFGKLDAQRIKGLLFDVDGTLSDTDDHWVARVIRFLNPVSWLFKNKDPRQFARWLVMATETPANSIYALADKLHLDGPFAAFYNWIVRVRKIKKPQKDRFWIIPGVQEMLGHYHGRYPMAVVSARDALTTHYFLEHFHLKDYFDAVVTAQTCKHTKPYPDPVVFAAQALGLEPRDCVMIGDTIVDVRAGKAAGAQTIGVLCGFGTLRELNRAGADLILTNTKDLTNIVE